MSEAITPAQLEAQFGLGHEVAHHGLCIVVPADRFLPQWEPQLRSLGYYIIQTRDLQHKKVVLVTHDKPESTHDEPAAPSSATNESTPFTSSTSSTGARVRGNLSAAEWSGTDKERLLKRVAELGGTIEEKCKLLTNEFPGRSAAAIHQKYVKLQRARKAELPSGSLAEFPWSDADERKLLQRMNELEGTVYERAALLMPEFPGRSVVSLRQKFYKLTGLKGSSKRKPRPRPELLHVPWTPKEDELLIELWNRRLIASAIAQKLPGRSLEAVHNRLGTLQNLKRIKPRWKQKPKIQEPKESSNVTEPKSTSTPVHAPTSTPTVPVINTTLTIQLNVNCNDGNAVANFLKIIEKMRLRE